MLSARGVSYRYDADTAFEVAALLDVDLDIRPGRLTLVAGETGSGKTTLLRLLAGLAQPTEGTVTVEGAAPEPAASDSQVRVGLLFQRAESQLFAESVEADVMFGPTNLGLEPEAAREAAHEALAAVGLSAADFGERSPFTLSGGEGRRVALAGILAMDPRFLLLDEPTAGLDASGREAVREAVVSSRARCGVVVVTHDVEEFLEHADDVVVLEKGRIVFSGPVDEFVLLAATSPAEIGMPVPATIRVQSSVIACGIELDRVSTDPVAAAREIARAGGWA